MLLIALYLVALEHHRNCYLSRCSSLVHSSTERKFRLYPFGFEVRQEPERRVMRMLC